jgi:hypothetical protein
MFRLTFRLITRKFSRRTATVCDSRWFRLVIVVLLTCLLLPLPRVRAMTPADQVKSSINIKPGDDALSSQIRACP